MSVASTKAQNDPPALGHDATQPTPRTPLGPFPRGCERPGKLAVTYANAARTGSHSRASFASRANAVQRFRIVADWGALYRALSFHAREA